MLKNANTLVFNLLIMVLAMHWQTVCAQNYTNLLDVEVGDALERLVYITDLKEHVNCIQEDTSGNIWLGTNAGLYKYDGQRLEHIYRQEDGLLSISIQSLLLDPDGSIWVGTLGYGLQKFNPYTQEFRTFEIPIDLAKYPSRPYHISNGYGDGFLLCAMDRSFGLFSIKEEIFVQIIHDGFKEKSINFGFVRCIEPDPLDRNIWWLGTTSGLIKFNSKDTSFYQIENPNRHPKGLVRTFCFDSKNRLIYTDDFGGVFLLNPGESTPKKIINLSTTEAKVRLESDVISVFGENLLIGNRATNSFIIENYSSAPEVIENGDNARYLSSIFMDKMNRLWLGHKSGFSIFNPKYNIATKIDFYSALKKNSLVLDADQWSEKSDLFIAPAQNEGLLRIDFKTGKPSFKIPDDLNPKKSFLVKGLSFDDDGILWVSSNQGLFKYDPELDRFSGQLLAANADYLKLGKVKYYKDDILILRGYSPQRMIFFNTKSKEKTAFNIVGEEDCQMPLLRQFRDFDLDREGGVWIAGRPYILHLKDGCYEEFKLPDSINIEILGSKCINLDHKNNLYLGYGTRGMVKVTLDNNPPIFTKYGIGNGMPTDQVLGIESDELGATWVANGSGLTYSKDDSGFQQIALPNLSDEGYFDYPRVIKTMHSGNVVLGGDHSILILDVNKAANNLAHSKPKIQSLQWGNQESIDILQLNGNAISIPYEHKSIFIRFSDYDFGRPNAPTYQYRLVNKSQLWQPVSKAEIDFYDLPYGDYELEVAPNLGNDSNLDLITRLYFKVMPPWYFQIWFILLWILLATALLYSLYKYLLRRQLVAERLSHVEEVKDLQNKLFANITHELRTPLSLIISSSKNISEDNIESNRKSILNNAGILTNYVDQLLDLSSIDEGKFSLNKAQIDSIHHLKLIVETFDSMAAGKNITLHQLYNDTSLMMDFDVLSFRKIVSNLVHNALKFTPKGGHIYITSENKGDHLKLTIRDTGGGIKEEHQPYIFDRYYKTFDLEENLGSGIGMALTKDLVELHQGTISFKSSVGKGTNFTILLPITTVENEKVFLNPLEKINYSESISSNLTKEGSGQDYLLIVEDNINMNNYIASVFKNKYQIIQKHNGSDGFDAALEYTPKLIISDVMMPQMDGFQLVHLVKDDWRTCNIPIILLTAKADRDSRLEGLSEGADAYLAKPFDVEELKIVAKNLIANRTRILEKVGGNNLEHTKLSILEQTVLDIINDNIIDAQLSVDFIAQKMGKNRSTLFREMKDDLGISPSKYIKKVKLHKAIDLLENSELRISEIAFQTGFNDPSYFTRIFKSEMGMSPQEFRDS